MGRRGATVGERLDAERAPMCVEGGGLEGRDLMQKGHLCV